MSSLLSVHLLLFRRRRWVSALLGGLVLALAVLCAPARAAVDITQGWEYRWGDSPFSPERVPTWTLSEDTGTWQPIDFPSNPPNRNGQENVWYRVTLPEGEWRDPVLYIYSVDLIVEVYLDGRKIYQYGEFDEHGRGRFAGWPWHMITLPAAPAGETLYFRIFSNYHDIGLWGEVKLMERMALIRYVVENSGSGLVIGSFGLLIALIAALFAALQSERRTFVAVVLYALATGGMAIGTSQAKLLLWENALFWDYIAAGSYFLTPIAMALLLEDWLHGRAGWFRNIRWGFVGYLGGAMLLSLAGWVNLSSTYPVFDLLFALSLPLFIIPMLRYLPAANGEQRALILANGLLILVLLLSMAVAHSVLPWSQIQLSWGTLAFTLIVVTIAVHRYIRTQRSLKELNASLEAKVSARTAELETLAARESGRAQALEFGNRKSAVLEELVIALQRCKTLRQCRDALTQGVPNLCEPIPGGLYLLGDDGRHCGLSAHWGASASLLPPHLITEGDRSCAVCEVQEARWQFPLTYEHPSLGKRPFGLIALCLSATDDSPITRFNDAMLHALLERGVDKINLTLSQLSLQEELSRLSYEDALTGLKNRRFLDELLEREIQLAQRQQTPLSVILFDIDHFKRFNDTYGHAAGDEALRAVAQQLRQIIRQTDIACRYGGEEFVIVMPNSTSQVCQDRAEALRSAIAAMPIVLEGLAPVAVTVSAGIACWPDDVMSPCQLLKNADKALYAAKQRGRNRIERAA